MSALRSIARALPAGLGVAAALAMGADRAECDILLNEITVQGTEMVELYNSGVDTVDVQGWTIQESGSWVIDVPTPVPPGEYVVVSPPGDILGDQGGYIELLEITAEDGVYYGKIGSAPLPPDGGFPFARGTTPVSLARAPDGSAYSMPPAAGPSTDGTIWTIDVTSTFGAMNDVPAPSPGASVLLNELDPKPAGGGDLVELYNPLAVGLPLTGWYLCNGDAFQALSGTVPGGGYWTITTDPGFDLETDELVYLFRDDHVRIDQIGLNLPPVRSGIPTLAFCQCFARFPDGAGPTLGYDWFTSGGDATLLRVLCSPGAANQNQPSCAVTDTPGGVEAESWSRTKSRWR